MRPAFPTLRTSGGSSVVTGGDVTETQSRIIRPGDDSFLTQYELTNPFAEVSFAPAIAELREESLGILRDILGTGGDRLNQFGLRESSLPLPFSVRPIQGLEGIGALESGLPSVLPASLRRYIDPTNQATNPFYRARVDPYLEALRTGEREASRRGVSGPLAQMGLNPIRQGLANQAVLAQEDARRANLETFAAQLTSEQARREAELSEETARFSSQLAAEQAGFQSRLASGEASFLSQLRRGQFGLEQEQTRIGAEQARFTAEQALREMQQAIAADISGEAQAVLAQELAALGLSQQQIRDIFDFMLVTTESGARSESRGREATVDVGVDIGF